jgi:hypothetical protein
MALAVSLETKPKWWTLLSLSTSLYKCCPFPLERWRCCCRCFYPSCLLYCYETVLALHTRCRTLVPIGRVIHFNGENPKSKIQNIKSIRVTKVSTSTSNANNEALIITTMAIGKLQCTSNVIITFWRYDAPCDALPTDPRAWLPLGPRSIVHPVPRRGTWIRPPPRLGAKYRQSHNSPCFVHCPQRLVVASRQCVHRD